VYDLEIVSAVLLKIRVFLDVTTCRWAIPDVSKDSGTNLTFIGPCIVILFLQ